MEKYPVGGHESWEDSYSAEVYASFDSMMQEAQEFWLGPFASINWPVWISYDAINEMEWDCGPTIQVGVFHPRHGRCSIHVAPCTPEQRQVVAQMLMSVWARRADIQFERHGHLQPVEVAYGLES